MELQELQIEMQKTWSAYKERNDVLEGEIKRYGDASQETKNVLDKINDRLDSVETKMNRPAVGPVSTKEEPLEQEKGYLAQYLRKGIIPAERKATFIEGTSNLGGYTVVQQYLQELVITSLTEMNPIRQYARNLQCSSSSLRVPTRVPMTSVTKASDEITTQRTATNVATPYNYVDVTMAEYYAIVELSKDLLEDSVFDLESEVRNDIIEQIGYQEGKGFISGTASPLGILYAPAGAQVVGTGTSANWPATNPADKIWDTYFLLKEPYATRGVWALKRATLGSIRKFKTSDGQYLWAPGINEIPNTICGAPYFLCADWDAVGASKYIMAFGDWKRGYAVVDRIGMQITRDELTKADYNTVRFIARYRVGGAPLIAEAISYLQCGA